MKVLILLSLLTTLSYADADKSQNIDQLKQMISGNIDQHISLLQNFKSCIQSASGREQLQACRQSNKEAMEKFRAENKDERKSFKEEMKARREEKRASREKKE